MRLTTVLLCTLVGCHSRPQIISTDAGLVSGTSVGEVRIFKGIPFAAPPVGPLRWREPQPVAPWTGVRRCVSFGPNPIQNDMGGCSEDCLYLNIWTAKENPPAKKPVMVRIYGGGFTAGSGASGWCDGEDMARKGVVFVTFNYRVGVLGFLAHPALSAESPNHVSGNYGMLDQIAALQWVKRNIAAFGGDPANVTVAGESAGSCSINTLIASPLARGLFRRAIAESGALFKAGLKTLQEAEEDGVRAMRSKHALTLKAMRDLSPDSLLKGDYRRLPVVDGYLLPDRIDELFRKGAISKVDLMTGYNEGDMFVEDTMNATQFVSFAQRNYGTRAGAFLTLYPAENVLQSQRALFRDLRFGWEQYTWAKEEGARAYMYYFDRVPPGEPKLGAFHSAEVCYALHTLAHQRRPWTSWDTSLSNLMSSYWVNFAFIGDPNGNGLPRWPVFSAQNTKVIRFGDSVETIDLPAMRAFGFFEPYLR